jgi:hypothetical protein
MTDQLLFIRSPRLCEPQAAAPRSTPAHTEAHFQRCDKHHPGHGRDPGSHAERESYFRVLVP